MIEVAFIGYGLAFSEDGQTEHWPLVVRFGPQGPETTVNGMMEGEGHTYLELAQLLALIAQLQPEPGEVQLVGHPPPGLACELLGQGYFVRVIIEE